MSGIFLSYSRADRALAERVVQGLRDLEVEVWWDEDMPGVDWQDELEAKLNALAGVLVLWTPNSVNSRNVRDEARLALSAEKLINVLSDLPQPPFPFDRVNGLPLDGWTGFEPHGGWSRLATTVDALLAHAGAATRGQIIERLARRQADLKARRQALDGARADFQAAQSRAAEADEAEQGAKVRLAAAEEQHRKVVEMSPSRMVLQAAHQELAEAHAEWAETDKTLRQAKADLSLAARVLAQSQSGMEGEEAPKHTKSPRVPAAMSPAQPVPKETVSKPSPKRSGRHRLFITFGVALGAVILVTAVALIPNPLGDAAWKAVWDNLVPLLRRKPPASDSVSTTSPGETTGVGPFADRGENGLFNQLLGSWAAKDQSCAHPLSFSIKNGVPVRTYKNEETEMNYSNEMGPKFSTPDGHTYQINDGNTAVDIRPVGGIFELHPCASALE
jgi:hypothetical protein